MVIERNQTLVLKISNETFHLFFGMLLLSGSHKLIDRKIYYETFPDTFVKVMFCKARFNKVFFKISVNWINKNNFRSFVPRLMS